MAGLRLGETGAFQLHARVGQHVMAEIKAEGAIGAGREQFEHAPGAGAEVDEERERPLAEGFVDSGLDLLLGDVERADSVPLAGMFLEIILRGFLARLVDGLGAGAVSGEDGVGGVEARDDRGGERRLVAAVGETEEHPAALAEAPDQAGLGHQLQVPADARLALAEDLGEVLDVELAPGEERQDAEPRRLASGAKQAQGVGARQACSGGAAGASSSDIKICLYVSPELSKRAFGPARTARWRLAIYTYHV